MINLLPFIRKTIIVNNVKVDLLKNGNFRIKSKNKVAADKIAKYIKEEDLLSI